MVAVKRHAEGDQQTKLFQIENRVGHRQFVVAIGTPEALALSAASRHILSSENGVCREWPLSVVAKREEKFAGSLRRALGSKLQGVAARQGDFAIIEGEVFMPIAAS